MKGPPSEPMGKKPEKNGQKTVLARGRLVIKGEIRNIEGEQVSPGIPCCFHKRSGIYEKTGTNWPFSGP